MLTITDMLEAIAGDLPDASEMEVPDIRKDKDGFIVSGGLPLDVLRQRLGFQAKATQDYQTLAGLVMSLLDRLPVKGDRVEWLDWSLTVTDIDERRVSRVYLRKR